MDLIRRVRCRVFKIRVDARFSAAHALVIQGQREPIHGHDWLVQATLAGPALDGDELLCDFHAVEADLREITAPFHNANLNTCPPFDRVNPSAEAVARHIAAELSRRLETRSAREPKEGQRAVRVESVLVTEAPGCAAIFEPS